MFDNQLKNFVFKIRLAYTTIFFEHVKLWYGPTFLSVSVHARLPLPPFSPVWLPYFFFLSQIPIDLAVDTTFFFFRLEQPVGAGGAARLEERPGVCVACGGGAAPVERRGAALVGRCLEVMHVEASWHGPGGAALSRLLGHPWVCVDGVARSIASSFLVKV
jgi:hypothetical protein